MYGSCRENEGRLLAFKQRVTSTQHMRVKPVFIVRARVATFIDHMIVLVLMICKTYCLNIRFTEAALKKNTKKNLLRISYLIQMYFNKK